MPRRRSSSSNITRTLGQHALVDQRTVERIVRVAQIRNHETVLEAGTGQGTLTAELCKVAKQVVSYEIDSNLYRKAKEQLLSSSSSSSPLLKNLVLENADLFSTKGLNYFDVFVSNLPYSRSRDAFEWLSTQKFGRATVMVQDEFADKLAAKPGSKNYRAISVLAAHCFVVEKLFKVSKQSFEPQPKVESSVIRIIPVNMVTKEIITNIHLLFSKRNKRAASVVAETGISNVNSKYGNRRIDELEPADIVKIAESLSNVQSV